MKKPFFFWFIASLLLLSAFTGCSNDDEDTPSPDPISSYTTAEEYVETTGFQGTILLRKGGTDILRQGFGMADMASKVPNDMDTRFRIGSMSKAFTSLGIVYLKRAGVITSYDQPVSDFAEDFPYGDQITLRHLLTHSSGLQDYIAAFEEVVIDQGQYLSPSDILDAYAEAIADEGILFTPGSKTQYSNTNYLMMGLLIEELTDIPYHEFLAQIAVAPLDMTATYKSADDFGGNGEAVGYRNGSPVAPYPMELAFGAGDWASSVSDMEKWGDAWLGDLLTDAEKAEVFPSPFQDEVTRFGMGWFVLRTHGKLVYFHGGDIDGFTSLIALYPESNGMLIALSNQEAKRNQLDNMIEVFAKEEF